MKRFFFSVLLLGYIVLGIFLANVFFFQSEATAAANYYFHEQLSEDLAYYENIYETDYYFYAPYYKADPHQDAYYYYQNYIYENYELPNSHLINYEYIEEAEKEHRTIYEHKNEILYFLERFPNTSVFYQNIETGFTIAHNEREVYFSASVTKAPLALFVYSLARDGLVDLDYEITFTAPDRRGGSGIIRHTYPLGTSFPIRRLIGLNLYKSDNSATAMLMRYFGAGYSQFLISIGADPRMLGSNLTNSGLSAIEANIFALAIYDFIAEENPYSEEFLNNLLNNRFPFIVSNYPVASKTGWTAPIAWHDMAIIKAPSPFTLTILSARQGSTYADYRDFYEISMKFERFNSYWFGR
ncbi:MAG: class A beta-lactamase-related serine hydrolase [Defluviitaleaceae bacterium]|nr:class A beta-lactamase-related serine hydrolase [Defluviitaleaceae bacterium]